MFKRITREDAEQVPLPGRVWHSYFAPKDGLSEHLSLGVSVFPAGSRPEGHVHPTQEETIYCAAGRGRIVTPEGSAEVWPGVIVHVKPGTVHATESDGPEPLELLCIFTPPVVSGSYEQKDK